MQGFIDTYAAFLVNLTLIHGNPRLPIFAGAGPITLDYAPWVQAAIAKSGTNAHFVNYTTILDGCGHPGWEGHEQMFEIVKPLMASVMGWEGP